MGRVLLVVRLAVRDLRRRPAEGALLLLAIAGATTTLTLGLVLRGVIDKPYQRTRAATSGPDVVAALFPHAGAVSREARSLATAAGVVARSGPYPVVPTVLEANGRTVLAQTEGRDSRAAAVDQPKPTNGGWVRDGGVVIEAAFARALGVSTGDRVTLKRLAAGSGVRTAAIRGDGPGRSFRVAGVAVTAATPPYPESACLADVCQGSPDTGVIWLTRADAVSLAPADGDVYHVLDLRLADPANAQAFAAAHTPSAPSGSEPPARFLQPWQDIAVASTNLVRNQRRALMIGAWLLALLAVASLAVLVGGRMADQLRRVGLLKAVGGTPGLVAAVLLTQYVFVALLAAAVGLALGTLTAPLVTDAGAGLLGSAGARTAGLSTIAIVTATALAVAVAATLVPAIRAARTSAVLALADAARPPRRSAWLIAVSARLPVPVLLGLRLAARRPRRTVLGAASIAITVAGIVAALSAHADIGGSSAYRAHQLNQVLLTVTVALVLLAAVNAVFIAWSTALDARRSSALARALGATPQQVSAGLSAAQVLPALAAAALGIPAGMALVAAVDPDRATTLAPLWQLLAVVPCTALIVAGLTAVPARIGARRPVADVLRSELA